MCIIQKFRKIGKQLCLQNKSWTCFKLNRDFNHTVTCLLEQQKKKKSDMNLDCDPFNSFFDSDVVSSAQWLHGISSQISDSHLTSVQNKHCKTKVRFFSHNFSWNTFTVKIQKNFSVGSKLAANDGWIQISDDKYFFYFNFSWKKSKLFSYWLLELKTNLYLNTLCHKLKCLLV